MRAKTAIIALLPALLVSAGCDLEEFGEATRYQAEFKESHPLPPGGRLYLENFNGSIEIKGWDEPTAEIAGTKYASRESALDAIRIDVVASGDSLRVRTVRPSGHSGNMGARYVIRVPKRVTLERILTSNGAIRVEGIEGALRLETSNGAVELNSASGPAVVRTSNGRIQATGVGRGLDAQTSNGSIRAVITQVEPGQAIRLRSSNGSVDLSLDRLDASNEVEVNTSNAGIALRIPPGTGARITARTSNGRITNEFDSDFMGRIEKNRLEGTLGKGGTRISLATSNGSIRLLRR
jgi:hypothetical protein